MKHPITITMPKPCEASWDDMTPEKGGRHCARCSKTVIDFTLMSDGEILDIFKKAKDNPPCGHFLASQLGRPLTDTRYKPSFIKAMLQRAAAVVLLLQGMSFVSFAQQIKKKTVTTQQSDKKPALPSKSLAIKGTLVYDELQSPLANVTIRIKGTDIHATTNNDGFFELVLPTGFDISNVILEQQQPEKKMLIQHPAMQDIPVRKDAILAGSPLVLYAIIKKPYETAEDVLRKKEYTQTGGPEVALTSGIYKSKLALSDTSRVQTKKDAMPTFKIALTGAYSRPTFWQRITKPFRRKVHKQ